MKKYIFVENGIISGCGGAPLVNPNSISIEVSDKIYNDFLTDRLKYIYCENKILPNPDYNELKQKEAAKIEIQALKTNLEELDKKRIRAVCENEIKDESTNQTWLDYYNSEIYRIRQRITQLSEII